MSDRQTPTSVMDRARSSILKFRASVIGMPLPSRLLMTERDLRDLADQIQNIGIRRPEVGPGFVQQMTPDQFRDHVVNSAAKGELYLWGVKVVIDDATHEIRCEGATRGAEEYRGDQHPGVDNSVQAAQGSRVAAGVLDGADLCTLGTADSPDHMKEPDKARAYREAKPRCRYDWYLQCWVEGDTLDAVAIGGPLHGQRLGIHRSDTYLAHRGKQGRLVRYVRQDYTHSIPYPQRYTALVEEGSRLPPSYEVRDLAHRAGVIRWAGQQEMERIRCLATGVPHG